MNIKIFKTAFTAAASLLIAAGFTSCEDSVSYSDLLKDEEHAVNWFLAQQKVCPEIPADTLLQYGADAPYYRVDEEGALYMQVINPGKLKDGADAPEGYFHPKDVENMAKSGDRVYFRFKRRNIKNMFEDTSAPWIGNAEDLTTTIGPTYFVYGNRYLQTTTQYGLGVQEPMKYVGFQSEVNIVVKASMGFTDDQSSCIPYQMNIRYFKPEF